MRFFALLVLLLGVPLTSDAQFRDTASGLAISPPDDFLRQAEDPLAPPSVISCWYASETEDYPWVRMCAERLDRLPRADEKLSFTWEGRTLRGSRTRVRADGKDLMQYSALIPLGAGTIRLDVVTPVRGAEDAKILLEESLASVRDEGRVNAARAGDRRGAEGGVGKFRVTDSGLGYTLEVPADIVHAWNEPRPENKGMMALAVQRLRFVIGREQPTAADLPDPGMELLTFEWRGFDVHGVKAITEDGGAVTFLVQVPLRREAIQLIVMAPIDETNAAHALITATLASLEGETNWLTSTERAERLGETAGRLILIPVVVGFIVWRRRKQRTGQQQAAAR